MAVRRRRRRDSARDAPVGSLARGVAAVGPPRSRPGGSRLGRGTGSGVQVRRPGRTRIAARPPRGPGPGSRGRVRALTGAGTRSGAAMLVLFFLSLLLASWLQWGVLAGAGFVIGSVGAAWYTRRRDLLVVAVSPPLLFFRALIVVKALTAKGSMIISTVEGTALTLANVAPWLFAGVIVYVIVAWVRGLPQCVADLRHDLRPDLAQPRSGTSGAASSRAAYQPGHGTTADFGGPARTPRETVQYETIQRGAGQRGAVRRSSGGGAKTSRSSTASTSSTVPNPCSARYSSTPATSSSGTEAPLVSPTVATPSSQAGSIAVASSTR